MKKIIRTLILIFALTAGLALFVACEKEQPKTKLENPIVAAQVYTGSKLTAEVPQNDGYRIVSNEGGTDVGEYDVVLELTDATKYEWATPDSGDATKVTLKFVVTKAANRITALSLESWMYGEEAKNPLPRCSSERRRLLTPRTPTERLPKSFRPRQATMLSRQRLRQLQITTARRKRRSLRSIEQMPRL